MCLRSSHKLKFAGALFSGLFVTMQGSQPCMAEKPILNPSLKGRTFALPVHNTLPFREGAGVGLSHFRALCVIGLAVALDEKNAVAEEFTGSAKCGGCVYVVDGF